MKKIMYLNLFMILLITACGQTKKDLDPPQKEIVSATKNIEQSITNSTEKNFLENYLNTHNCENIYCLEENLLACVFQENEEYNLSILDLKKEEIKLQLKENYFDANMNVEKVGKYTVICQGRNCYRVPEELQAMVIDENMQVIDRIILGEEVTTRAFTLLPKQKKIIYVDTYGSEWKMCLKQCDYQGNEEKQLIQFSDVTKVADITCLKISENEKQLYFTGMYSRNQQRSGELLNCIGKITLGEQKEIVYQTGKTNIYMSGEEAYFYDDCVEETDGDIYCIHKDGSLTSTHLENRKDGKMGFSLDASLIWTLSQNRGKGQESMYTISVYRSRDGARIYTNSNTKISWGALFFLEEKRLLGFYFGEQALETEWLRY